MPTLPVGLTAPASRQGHASRTSATSPRRLPGQPRVRQRRHAPGARRAARPGVLRAAATRSGCGGGRRRCSPSAGTARSTTSTSCGRARSSWPRRSPPRRPSRSCTCRCRSRCRRWSRSARAALGLPEGFVFLLVYDFNSVLARKNPVGLIEAFLRAFPDPGEGARLVLKSINAERHPNEHDRVRIAAEGAPARAPARLLRLGRREERDDRGGRLLRLAAPLRGLRDHDGRGDAARQAGRRHRLLRQPRLHDDRRTRTSSTTSSRRSGPATARTRPRRSGPSPTSTTPRSCCARCSTTRRRRGAAARSAAADIRRAHSAEASGRAMEERLTRIRGTLPTDDFDPTGLARSEAAAAQELVRAGADAAGRRQPPAPRAARRRAAGDEAAHELRAAGRPRRHRRARCTSATRSSRSRAASRRSSPASATARPWCWRAARHRPPLRRARAERLHELTRQRRRAARRGGRRPS